MQPPQALYSQSMALVYIRPAILPISASLFGGTFKQTVSRAADHSFPQKSEIYRLKACSWEKL
jgi:hypothetical protein